MLLTETVGITGTIVAKEIPVTIIAEGTMTVAIQDDTVA